MEPDSHVQRVPTVDLPVTEVEPVDTVARFPLTYDYDFETFYLEARVPLARALAVTTGDRDLAVEAVDEAMARAYQRWSRIARLDNPGGWVYRVGLNWATSVLRRRKQSLPGSWQPSQVEAPVPAEPAVLAALAELDVRQRAVVVCRYLLGWSEAETAAALSTPAGTVKSRLHRANRLLSVRLAHLREEEY